jgi:hypothetical protein
MAVVTFNENSAELLRESMSGDVITPADPGYDDVRRVHNGLIDKRPAVIARCLGAADVVDALNVGREHGFEISVRGGGHNVTGRAVADGGLMVDLSRMKGIHVDPRRRTVRAQGGVIWREYNRAAGVFGLATTGGVVSSTGVAGLTLGGGIGWLMGKHGLAIDNLVSAEVVLASGEVVTASPEDDSGLFWAIRGGGGNFGVVTSLEFRAYPLATVLGGRVVYPLSATASLFAFLNELAGALPDELTIMVSLRMPPDGTGPKTCRVTVCHAGEDPGQAEAEVRPVREFGSPIVEEIARMPYPVMNTLLDSVFPRGTLNYWKSGFLSDLTEEAAAVLVAAFEHAPAPLCAIVIEQHHGALTRISPTATAYPHRERGYNVIVASQWTDREETERCVAWARDTFAALSPYMSDRAYVNYLAVDDADRVRHAYGPNYDRLVELKRRYDPENFFRLNQNIDPDS